jgi:hypothetical protein
MAGATAIERSTRSKFGTKPAWVKTQEPPSPRCATSTDAIRLGPLHSCAWLSIANAYADVRAIRFRHRRGRDGSREPTFGASQHRARLVPTRVEHAGPLTLERTCTALAGCWANGCWKTRAARTAVAHHRVVRPLATAAVVAVAATGSGLASGAVRRRCQRRLRRAQGMGDKCRAQRECV